VVEQEHEITDEQIEIQAELKAKARERERATTAQQQPSDYSAEEPEPEALPVPAAMIQRGEQHPGKRHGVNAVRCEYILRISHRDLFRIRQKE